MPKINSSVTVTSSELIKKNGQKYVKLAIRYENDVWFYTGAMYLIRNLGESGYPYLAYVSPQDQFGDAIADTKNVDLLPKWAWNWHNKGATAIIYEQVPMATEKFDIWLNR